MSFVVTLTYSPKYQYPLISNKDYFAAVKYIGFRICVMTEKGKIPHYHQYLKNAAYRWRLNEQVLHRVYQLWCKSSRHNHDYYVVGIDKYGDTELLEEGPEEEEEEEILPPPKKKRGRPKGKKNAPKIEKL